MRTKIKTVLTGIGISIFLSCSVSAAAQNQPEIPKNQKSLITVNYSTALKSNNNGVAESALYHSMLFAFHVENVDTHEIQEAVQQLYRTTTVDRIRHKAYLVDFLLSAPELMNSIEKNTINSEAGFYTAVTELISGRLLGASNME